ncbi:DUF3006 domain-containing protein [Clostridium botulinum]|uniref:DUF3006 domain-containing protein n=5 Tax=Clostridium botulinum TaxID=1491 RepID=A5I7Z1_CLOBH|nr:DUF3006 domain-containing protein [Clostridium botulinum]EKN39744.1 hypothetical protein CFSAN001627_22409 [Clostridium botulinum CFSAN001627]KRU26335.1 hypothetical protein VT91_29550 [Clostridium sporogenes]ABS33201.1 hypothetical protein CLB_3711 [Clostridium botulinum A str. ATCC 19397]ABS38652.1 hypothetical protein CLC_3617 [Clostridium botulinum A str. Hall]ACA44308.1 hypothetical protein CLD_0856 [Clostridium botulinum B1 str. Okra]
MKGIIDRFEENFAIIELEDKKMINIDKNIIPKKAKEGDVINIEGDIITLNEKERERLKKEIDELTEDMWKE